VQQQLLTVAGRLAYSVESGVMSSELNPSYHVIYAVMEVVLRTGVIVYTEDATLSEGSLHHMRVSLAGPLDWTGPSLLARTRSIQTSINTGVGHTRITKLTADMRDTLYFPVVHPLPLPPPAEVFIAGISLVSSQDRYERVRASLGIPEGDGTGGTIYFHRPVRDPRGGMAGCFQSHLDVFRLCLQRGCDMAIVFEDDLIPSGRLDLREALDRVRQIGRSFPDWRRVSLHASGILTTSGTCPQVPGVIHANSIYTRCYAISSLGMQEMLQDGLRVGQHVDTSMFRRFVTCPTFALVPPLTADNPETCEHTTNDQWGNSSIAPLNHVVNLYQDNQYRMDTFLSQYVLPRPESSVAGVALVLGMLKVSN